MKHFFAQSRRHREQGAALITALLVATATAMLLAASLAVSMTSAKLGWKQIYSQSALQLADAGINSELQFIAQNVGSSTITGKSSQPVVYSGVTAIEAATGSTVLGRPGTVSGFNGGTFYVYSSNNSAGTTAWDGVTSPFYITCSAVVNGVWQTVQVQSTANSLFNVYGIFVTGTTGSPSTPANNSIVNQPGAVVNITGPTGTNGGVSTPTGTTFTAPTAINANTGSCTSNRLTTTNVQSGGQLCSVQAPLCYPRSTDVCRTAFGCHSTDSDATVWSSCQSHSSNSTGVYTYNGNYWNTGTDISTRNCTRVQGGCGTTLNANTFFNCGNIKPGSYNFWNNGCQCTLIFEPGDYYFTSMQLDYQYNQCDMVIDSQALASGGTPGQVRFWLVDPSGQNLNDYCKIPMRYTCASGQSTPDPGMCRIYDTKCGGNCTFQHPSSCQDYNGTTHNEDFDYYCGVHCCGAPATTTTTGCSEPSAQTTKPCTFSCSGTSRSSTGCCNLHGSLLCDQLNCSGCCNIKYTPSQRCDKDPCVGGSVSTYSCHQG